LVKRSPTHLTLQVFIEGTAAARVPNPSDDATCHFTGKAHQRKPRRGASNNASAPFDRNITICVPTDAANSSNAPQRYATALIKCDSAARPRSRGASAGRAAGAAVSELQPRKPRGGLSGDRRNFGQGAWPSQMKKHVGIFRGLITAQTWSEESGHWTGAGRRWRNIAKELSLRERISLGPKQRFRLVGVGLSNFRESDDPSAQPFLFE